MDPEAAPLVNSAEAPRPRRQGVQVAVALVLTLAGCVAVLSSRSSSVSAQASRGTLSQPSGGARGPLKFIDPMPTP